MKILLAVDGSSYSKKMLAYLVTHDLFFQGGEFTVFTVQPLLPARARAAVGKEVVGQFYLDEAQRILTPVYKFLLRHGIESQSNWKTGHVGQSIAEFAEKGKFDLVVMGSHGHGTLVNLVMGSVATEVLAHCKVPVLLVR